MVTMKDLLECGVHFGHQTRRWNPKMEKFIFGERKNIHIIDLQQTLRYFRYTYNVVRDAATEGKTVLFVGTKKQARTAIKEHAQRCDMPYVASRWLGGMLTNYPTIKKSIRKLEIIEQMEENGQIDLLTKKEALMLRRKKEKLLKYLEGYRDIQKTPEFLFVIDAVKEHIAIKEARRMGMKIIAPLDTNCDPDLIDYPIPGNDDAIRSINLFCREMADAIIEGRSLAIEESGEDAEGELEGISEAAAEAANVTKEEIAEIKEEVAQEAQEVQEKPEAKKEKEKSKSTKTQEEPEKPEAKEAKVAQKKPEEPKVKKAQKADKKPENTEPQEATKEPKSKEVKEKPKRATAQETQEVKEKPKPKKPKAKETKEAQKKPKTQEKPKKAKAEKKGDDLTKIKGIGKVYQGKLNSEGVFTYEDVANMSEEQIAMMEEKYSFKGDFKESVAHAKELAAAK